MCIRLDMSVATYHRWRRQYGGVDVQTLKRLKVLEAENLRLKRIVADQVVDISILKEVAGELLSPARRRAAVWHVQRQLEVSERRACRVLKQARSTQRYEFKRLDQDGILVARMEILRGLQPRHGYRRIWQGLVRGGWKVNLKRVYRLRRDLPLLQRPISSFPVRTLPLGWRLPP